MTINTLARFCQAMKDIGVEPVSTPLLGYRYDVIESGHAFSLLIHEPDEAFLQAPKVTILSKPKIEGVKQTHSAGLAPTQVRTLLLLFRTMVTKTTICGRN